MLTGQARFRRIRLSRLSATVMVMALGLVSTVCSGVANQVSIDTPGFVLTATVIAAVGLVVSLVDRGARWWATWGAMIAGAATALVVAAHWWVSASGLVADHYPPSILLWVWLGVWAIGVGATGWWSGAGVIRMARVLTVPVAVLTAFLLINAYYGYWPTLGVLLDRPVAGQVSAPEVVRELSLRSTEPAIGDERWTTARSRRTGLFGPIALPAVPVAFTASPAWLWLPPAFFRSPPGRLPVLLMLTGLPGTSRDWVTAGQAVALADVWANRHQGDAPVMIFLDENGRGDRDTECVNGPQGFADAYLSRDVPAWVASTLGIHPDPSNWGVVGFSEGSTCALDLAIEHPDLFGRFVDIAGDVSPNHGGSTATLQYLYGGSVAAAHSL